MAELVGSDRKSRTGHWRIVGIGRATAELLAECGAAVAINYHQNEDGAQKARAAIESKGGHAVAIQADVTRAADVRQLVDEPLRNSGP